ncbi:MAG: ABC transporter ATP-binding protein [Clostridiales bacterium]|nr:ABC transporter ATP-binding protein [Clostridiales bacterium]
MASHTYSPEALSKAVTKYKKNKYDRIVIDATKESGLKEIIYSHAAETGESVNTFLKRAALEAIERDKAKTQPSE